MYNFQGKGAKMFGKRNITLKMFGDVGEKPYLCGQIAKKLRYEEEAKLAGSFPQTLTSLSSLNLREKSWST